tara:strand:+ start:331 stop:471 length:141 start_codon:yes stop_codon:yes gene_type:complete
MKIILFLLLIIVFLYHFSYIEGLSESEENELEDWFDRATKLHLQIP